MTVWEFGAGSEIAGLDTERILNTLASHGVEYVLVGGLAAIAHGSTLATADADVVPRRDADNLERLLRALQELGGKVPVDARRLAMEDGEPWEVADRPKDRAMLEELRELRDENEN